MGEPEHKEQCFFCGQWFHFGHHKYYGRLLKEFQVMACNGCLQGNEKGGLANKQQTDKLFAHLDELGIPRPEFNEQGFIDLK